jgi:Mn-dependent DtxR family transcriptional regulator
MITISKEDYLKAIAEAEAEGQTVIPATLAHWLSVTRPAVTFALKRLAKDGLISATKEGHIRLTPQGRQIAERTILRHHLIERMLSEMFGMSWYEIHDEAERLGSGWPRRSRLTCPPGTGAPRSPSRTSSRRKRTDQCAHSAHCPAPVPATCRPRCRVCCRDWSGVVPLQVEVFGLIDHTHSAAAQLPQHAVMRDGAAQHKTSSPRG